MEQKTTMAKTRGNYPDKHDLAQQPKHTPTPWRCSAPVERGFPTLFIPFDLGEGWSENSRYGEDRSVIHSQNADNDIAFIVRAVNCHDELLETLDEIRDRAVFDEMPETLKNKIKKVLAKARG